MPSTNSFPFGTAAARALLALFLVTALLGADAQAARYTSTIAGGTAFRDKNKNGQPDEGSEITAPTNGDGSFNLRRGKGRVYVTGGTDLVSGRPNNALLTTPPAARAVGTLTALWQALLDRKQSGGKVKKLLNIPKNATVVNYVAKPFAEEIRPKNQTLIKRNAQHGTLVQFLKSLSAKAGATKLRAAQRLAAKAQATRPKEDPEIGALAEALIKPSVKGLPVVDWTDPATLETILILAVQELGLPPMPDEIKQAAAVLAIQNQLIEQGELGPVTPSAVSAVTGDSRPEGTPLTYRVSLAAASALAIELPFAVTAATATGEDYGTPGFSDGVVLGETGLTVPAGVTEFTITLPTVDDSLFEGTETIQLTVGGVNATGTIADNDSAPAIASVTGDSGAEGAVLVLSVGLSNGASSPQTFDFAVAGITAAASDFGAPGFSDGVTYDAAAGKITVPALVTGFTVSLPSTADTVDEPDETVSLSVGGVAATATIVDDDPVPAIATVADAGAAEGSALSHAVTLTNASSAALRFTFELAGNTAAASDFGAPGFSNGVIFNADGSITVPAGVTGFTVTIPATDDSLDEADETLDLAVGGIPATGTIIDNDGAPAVASVTGGSNTEGTPLTFAVSLSNASGAATGFDFSLTGGTAAADDFGTPAFDSAVVYDAAAGRITVPAGVSAFSVSVPTTGDTVYESDETLSVSIGGVSATGTIVDDDGAPTIAAVQGDAQPEGTPLAFGVTLSNASATALTFDFALAGDTAGASDFGTPGFSDGVSFSDATGQITVPAGVAGFTVTVPTTADSVDEPDETLSVTVDTVSATGTIADDDGAPAVASISADSKTEGTTLVHTVTLSNASSAVTSFAFGLAGGSASAADFGAPGFSAGVVYDATTGRISVPAGVTSFTVSVPTTDDSLDEADETLTVSVGAVSATGTITDNDGAAAIASVTSETRTEGTALVHIVTLTNASSSATSFGFALAAGSAAATDFGPPSFSAGVSYDAATGQITVPADVAGFSVTIPTTDDNLDEPDETLTLSVGGIDATGTIADNDAAPTVVSVGSDNRTEGGTLAHPVALSNPSAGAVSFAFALTPDTAQAADFGSPAFSDGVTYDSATGDLTIPAGITGFTVSVATVQDTVAESSETVSISVGGINATGTIIDDDGVPAVAAVSSDSQTEGIALVHTVSLSNTASSAITLSFTLAGNSAAANDFGTPSFGGGVTLNADGSLNVPADTASFTITVPTTADTVDETDETIDLTVGTVSATGTIVDDDGAPAVATIAADSQTEGNALNHAVTLSNGSASATTFLFSLSGNTASADDFGAAAFSAGVSYDATAGEISVPAGVTAFTVTVPTSADTLDESDETLTITVGTISATGTIVDDDATPAIASVGSDSKTEGTTLIHAVSLSNGSASVTTFAFSLAGTTAAAGDFGAPAFSDGVTYDATAGEIRVPAGLTAFTVAIPTTDDTLDEPDESLSVKVGTITASGTIVDNDAAPAVAAVAGDSKTEGAALVHTVTLSNASASVTGFAFSLAGGTAAAADFGAPSFSAGVSYDAAAGQISIPANVASFTVTIPTTDDSIDEADETLSLNVGGVSATGTILDNDATPAVATVSADSKTEGTALVHTVTLTNTSASTTSFGFSLAGNSATAADFGTPSFSAGVTYDAGTNSVSVPANTGSFTVSIPTTDDSIDEADETLTVTVGTVGAVGTIVDNDAAPAIASVTSDSKTEGTALSHTVTLSNAASTATTYDFALAGNTAAASDFGTPTFSAGVTYSAATGRISVPADVASFVVSVPTTADTVDEPDETLELTVGTITATGTILDDDPPPAIASVTADSQAEGLSLNHTVSLSNGASTATSFAFTLAGNTAQASDFGAPSFSAGVTYSAATGQITVPAAVTSFVVTVPTVDDTVDEADETLEVTVGAITAVGTIADNDGAPAVATVSADAKTEGSALVHTVTLSNGASTATSFVFTLAGNTAQAADFGAPSFSAGVTYSAAAGQISVPAGVTGFTVTVPTTQDTEVEADETLTVTVGTITATGTIRDDDQAVVTTVEPGAAGAKDDNVAEGTALVYTVTLSTTTARTASYGLTLGGGSAEAADYGTPAFSDGVSYDAVANTVSVPAGLAGFTVTLPTVDDTAVEPTETVPLSVGGITGTGGILDNDQPGVSAIEPGAAGTADDAVTEGQPLVYTVTLASAPLTPASYPLSLAGGTAAAADYTALSAASFSNGVTYDAAAGTVSVPANVASFTVTVATLDDSTVEADETLPLTLGGGSATGFILDNDQPTVTTVEPGAAGSADNSVTEGNPLVYTVTLATATLKPASYPMTFGGSAIVDSDYDSAPAFSGGVSISAGNLKVPAGVTSFTITLTTIDDAAVEAAETLDLTVGGITGAGGILDNDPLIDRVAGLPGKFGYDRDGVPAIEVLLNEPAGIAVTGDGGLFIADAANHRIRRVDRQGLIATVAGLGSPGFGGDGKLAVDALLNQPMDVVADSSNNLYIADYANHVIRRVDAATQLITTVAGIAGSPGYNGDGIHPLEAQLNFPSGLALVSDFLLYVADSQNHRVRRIDLVKNIISTVAGVGKPTYAGDGFPAIRAGINLPLDVAVDSSGAFYIADSANHIVRRVDTAGDIDTFAGVPNTPGYGGDGGPALKATLNTPRGLALGLDGSLYLADAGNAAVRRVDLAGTIATAAGIGKPGYGGDGGPAADAQLDAPFGLAVGLHGNLFLADTGNHIVRRLPTLSPIYADDFDLDAAKKRAAGVDLDGLPVLVSSLGATPWASIDLGLGGRNTLAGDAANGYVQPNPEQSSSLLSLPATLATGTYQLSAELFPDLPTLDSGYLGLGFFGSAKPASIRDPSTTQLMLLLEGSTGLWHLYAPGINALGAPVLLEVVAGEVPAGGWSPATPPALTLTWNTAAKTASASLGGVYLFENLGLANWRSDATAVKHVGIPRDQAMGAKAVIDNFRFSRVLPP
jgi:hypothetical protein